MTAEERIQVEGVVGSSSAVLPVSGDAKRRILFVDDETTFVIRLPLVSAPLRSSVALTPFPF